MVVAVVTEQFVLGGVEDEGDVAVRAALGVSAVVAEDLRRESAPVEEQDGLAVVFEGFLERFGQRA